MKREEILAALQAIDPTLSQFPEEMSDDALTAVLHALNKLQDSKTELELQNEELQDAVNNSDNSNLIQEQQEEIDRLSKEIEKLEGATEALKTSDIVEKDGSFYKLQGKVSYKGEVLEADQVRENKDGVLDFLIEKGSELLVEITKEEE